MLTIELREDEIFCHYLSKADPTSGYLGRVWDGGSFKGLCYEYLREMGEGTHDVELTETLDNVSGDGPEYPDDYGWAQFCFNSRSRHP